MKKSLLSSLVILTFAVIGLLYSGWGTRQVWNQKIYLEVETPTGFTTSTTVLTYKSSKFPKRLNASSSRTLGLFGEAPFIEIAPGRFLFVLSLYAPYEILKAYAHRYQIKLSEIDALKEHIVTNQDLVEMRAFETPQFFTFSDPSDPKSLKEINIDHLDREFGEGVKFRSIRLQTTREPKTKGKIEKILPWLQTHRGPLNPVEPSKSWHKSWHKADFTTLNRSILTRHYECTIDGYTLNNLTYGLWRTGIGCKF